MPEAVAGKQEAVAACSRYYWLGVIALIFAAMLALYWPAVHGGFLWDDNDNVTKPELRNWVGLERIWFEWGATQTYYPLLHTLYWVEQKLWGDATVGYHVASILFHSISVYLLYLIVRRLQIPGALLAAGLFAVHPIYVESIAWITEQKNTLSGMFYLGSLLLYLRYDEERRGADYAWALVLFLCSLGSKTTAVTLPAALVVILWWRWGTLSWRRDIAPLVPWFALSLLFGCFTVWYEQVYVGAEERVVALSFLQKCLLASRAVWFYLSKLFWPANLTFIYPRWEIDAKDAWQYSYAVGLLALFAAAWWVHRRWRGPLAALLIFVGTLLPLLGFLPTYIFRYTYVCDHFQYLPSLAIVVLVAAGAASMLSRLGPARFFGQVICVLVLVVLALLTWHRSHAFSDGITLYEDTIARNPNCWMAYNNLGIQWMHSGEPKKAEENFERALQIKPDYNEAYNNLGVELASEGRIDEAMEKYRRSIEIMPEYPDAHFNLARLYLEQGRLQDAKQEYETTLRYSSRNAKAHNNLGNTLKRMGLLQEAAAHYRQAIELDANTFEAHYNLADTLVQLGQWPEAMQEFQQAILLNPTDVDAWRNLAATYAALKLPGQAVQAGERALELAKSQGQTEIAQKIADWLAMYRADSTDHANEAGDTPKATPQ